MKLKQIIRGLLFGATILNGMSFGLVDGEKTASSQTWGHYFYDQVLILLLILKKGCEC